MRAPLHQHRCRRKQLCMRMERDMQDVLFFSFFLSFFL